ncbi:MAG: hypothetical protein HY905_18385 [Deltaproteobacteria bacterium]|nr:hypothetical protein [Deltaproteobacteria bacterium]
MSSGRTTSRWLFATCLAWALLAAPACSRSRAGEEGGASAGAPLPAPPMIPAGDAGRPVPPDPKVAPYEAVVDKLIAELAAFGLAIDRTRLTLEVRGPEETREDIDRQQDMLFRPGHFEGLHALLRLFTDDVGADAAELRRATVESLAGAVAAYYQADRDALVFLDTTLGRIADLEALVAHELVHAWRDQQGGLIAFLDGNKSSLDRVTVGRCLMEGEAEAGAIALLLARGGHTLRELDPAALDYGVGRILGGEGGAATYQEGLRFMHARFEDGGWAAVRGALDAPPPSTEQLMHAGKLGRDEATAVVLPDWPQDLAPAELRFEDTVGETMIRSFLSVRGHARRDLGRQAMGWDGDRWRVWRTGDGGEALVWRTVWDREADALDFAGAFLGGAGDHRREGRVVDFALAEDPAVQRRLLDALATAPAVAQPQPDDAETTAAAEAAWEREQDRASSVEGDRWRIPRCGVSLPIPPGWSVREIRGTPVLLRADAEVFADNAVVVAAPNLEERDVGVLVERALADLDRVDAEIVRGPERLDLAGVPAVRVDYQGTMGGSRLLRFASLNFARPMMSVSVTVTVAAERWPELEAVVGGVLAGVQLDGQP